MKALCYEDNEIIRRVELKETKDGLPPMFVSFVDVKPMRVEYPGPEPTPIDQEIITYRFDKMREDGVAIYRR